MTRKKCLAKVSLILAILAISLLTQVEGQTVSPSPTTSPITSPVGSSTPNATATPSPTTTPTTTLPTSTPMITQPPTNTPQQTTTPNPTPTTSTISPTPTSTAGFPSSGYVNYTIPDPVVPEAPNVVRASYRIPLYLQSTVSVNFAPSNNKTVQPIPRYGSAYFESSGLDFVSVQMPYVDTYVVHIEVRYTQFVNQTVVINFLSGNLSVTPEDFQIKLDMCSMGFDLDLEITTRLAPVIPTADEIADAQMSRFNIKLDNTTERIERNVASLEGSVLTAVVLAAPGVFIALGSVILCLREREKRIKLQAEVEFVHGGRSN